MSSPPRRVVVIGAGAIGASTGALLHERGVTVVLVARGERGRALAERGVDLRFPTTARRVHVPVVDRVEDVTPEDLVLLATMGQHSAEALAEVDPAVTVASFQNGLLPLEVIAARGHPTLAAMVYVPAERRGLDQIALPGVPGIGAVLLGAWPAGGSAWGRWLVERLSEAGYRTEAEADIAPWIRGKLLVNLGGIVVALCDDPPVDVIHAAQAEAKAVWSAAGERFVDVPSFLERVGPFATAAVDGRPRVGGSTRSALARGEELETASLHGGILEAGRALGVPTPVNERLVRLAVEAVRTGRRAGSYAAVDLR